MRTGNPKSAIVAVAAVVSVFLGAIAALPYLPAVFGGYFQMLQNPTAGNLLPAVRPLAYLLIAFVVPTTGLGIAVAAISSRADV